MPKLKKEKKEGLKKELKRKVVVIKNAPVYVNGVKYLPNQEIENIDEAVMERLVNEGICKWVES